MSQMLSAPIILLKEGTDTSQGKAQIISNINACQVVVDILRTTLGPRGMDKLIHTEKGVVITNDGATVMDLLSIVHPATKVLVDIAKAQDDEVGDGTTSVVLFAGELLREAKSFIEDGIHPQTIMSGYSVACDEALKYLQELQINVGLQTLSEKRQLLERCAQTTLNSKLVSGHKHMFAKMVVDAVCLLNEELTAKMIDAQSNPKEKDTVAESGTLTNEDLDMDMIGIKKVTGGSCTDSMLIHGVAFKKTFSYAGFEQQPKSFKNPKILLLNLELELKAEKENAEIRLKSPEDYQAIVDAEWKIIFDKLDVIVNSGAQIVFSRLPIGDIATQYFADRNVFCAGRVEESDIKRTARATGAVVQTTVNGLTSNVLGSCGEFEEVQVGRERFNVLKKCVKSRSVTIILRGGANQFVEEAERSLHDAIMIIRRTLIANFVVGGGGAIEMELSRKLREYSRSVMGKQQLVINSFARALECIPRTLAHNSGIDSTDILNKLRQQHARGTAETTWIGVNCMQGGVCNVLDECIMEPALVKKNALSAATEAARLILSIDETVRSPLSQQPMDRPIRPPMGGRGGMRPRPRGGF